MSRRALTWLDRDAHARAEADRIVAESLARVRAAAAARETSRSVPEPVTD